MENTKKPKATNINLKANAENGSLLSIIGFVVMNAEDHNKTKMNGKILITFVLYLINRLSHIKYSKWTNTILSWILKYVLIIIIFYEIYKTIFRIFIFSFI